jgi:hypothetical protein
LFSKQDEKMTVPASAMAYEHLMILLAGWIHRITRRCARKVGNRISLPKAGYARTGTTVFYAYNCLHGMYIKLGSGDNHMPFGQMLII